MKATKFLAAVALSFLASTAIAQNVPMSEASAKEYVSGKTLEYARKNGQVVQMEFKVDGEVVTTNKSAGRVTKGTWKVDELGQVCQTYSAETTLCFLAYPAGFILWIEGKSVLTQK